MKSSRSGLSERGLSSRFLVVGLSMLLVGLMPLYSFGGTDDWVLGYFKSYVDKQVSKTTADVKKALSPKEKADSLLKAASEGKLDDVKQLLKNGADVNSRGKNAATPLMLACLGGCSEVGNALLKNKADIGNFSKSPVRSSRCLCWKFGSFDRQIFWGRLQKMRDKRR